MREEILEAVVKYARQCSKDLSVINGKDGLYNKMSKARLEESLRMKDVAFELVKCEKKEEERRVATENYERAREEFEKVDQELQPLKAEMREKKAELAQRLKCNTRELNTKVTDILKWLEESQLQTVDLIERERMHLHAELRLADLIDPKIFQEYQQLTKKIELLSQKIEQIKGNRAKECVRAVR